MEEDAIHPLDRFAIDPITLEGFVALGLEGVHLSRGAVAAFTVHVHGHLGACFAVSIEADEDGVGAAEAHRANGGFDEGAKTALVGVVIGNESGVFLARAGVDNGLDVDPDDEEVGECQGSAHGRDAAAYMYGATPVEGRSHHVARGSEDGVVQRGWDRAGPGTMEG